MAESQISQGIPLTIKTSNSKEYLSLDSNDAILEKHYELIRSLNFKAKKEAITRSQTINQASVSSSQDNTVIYDNHEKVSGNYPFLRLQFLSEYCILNFLIFRMDKGYYRSNNRYKIS